VLDRAPFGDYMMSMFTPKIESGNFVAFRPLGSLMADPNRSNEAEKDKEDQKDNSRKKER